MSERLRVGMIGCGDFAPFFAPYLMEKVDVVALSDPHEASLEETARKLNRPGGKYSDFRALLEQEKLDAVAITAANFIHAEATIAAADAGVHVYCEKAMARTVPECWAMVRACRKNNVKLRT